MKRHGSLPVHVYGSLLGAQMLIIHVSHLHLLQLGSGVLPLI